jgi:hypothetical protein
MKTSSSRVCTWRGWLKPAANVVRETEMVPPLASAGTSNSNRLLPYQTGSGRWLRYAVGVLMVVFMARAERPA